MKKLLLLFLLITFTLIIFTEVVFSQSQFDIVYLADQEYVRNPVWLNEIQNTWSATGINLRINRAIWLKYRSTYWNLELKPALDAIKDKGLKVYIRLSMGLVEADWEESPDYMSVDFHRRYTGDYYYNYNLPESPRPILNLTSHSKLILFDFMNEVIAALKIWQSEREALGKNADIELIVPSISPDDETVLPSAGYDPVTSTNYYELSGYSLQEISDFILYLQGKYTLAELNSSWGANFSSWSDIQPRDYHWETICPTYTDCVSYIYPKGRIDFIDFRAKQLEIFFSQCYTLFNANGYKFGLSFGSIYDSGIELAGFYDPTSLVGNAACIVNNDVPEYALQFKFAGDYLRSLCKYWNHVDPRIYNRIFGTETNWPEYSVDGHQFSDNNLMYYWGYQLDSYYSKGASVLFISHWGTGEKKVYIRKIDDYKTVAQAVIDGNLTTRFYWWKEKLKNFSKTPVSIPSGLPAVHLSCEQILNVRQPSMAPYYDGHNHNLSNSAGVPVVDGITFKHFPLFYFTRPRNSYIFPSINITYDENHLTDFITNKMIVTNPNYVENHYLTFHFNETSHYIPQESYVYLGLIDDRTTTLIDNETWIAPYSYMFTPGTYDEKGNVRTNLKNWKYKGLHKADEKSRSENIEIIDYSLKQNYPNPFNPLTKIAFEIPVFSYVRINVYNSLGQIVTELMDKYLDRGNYEINFDASSLSNGVYFYDLRVNNHYEIKKMLLLK